MEEEMKKRIISLMFLLMAAVFFTTACSNTGTETKKEETAQREVSEEKTEADPVGVKKIFVTPQWLKSLIDGNQEESKDYIILNVAWGEEADNPAYTEGHIPGAVHMNTDNIESEEFWNIRTPEEIEALCKKFGITKDTTVVVYGASPEFSGDDRAAMALLWAGVENVKALDGGIEAWTNAGYELEKGSNAPKATDKAFGVNVPAHPEYILSIDQVKDKLANDDNFRLVSIRSRDEFEGKTSGYGYIDRAGEPKGAIWGKDTDDGTYNNEDGTTIDIDKVEGILKESDASFDNEISYYCGTGWRAAVPFLKAYESGKENVTVYDGGWFQWQMDPENDVQLGDPKTSDVQYVKVKDLTTDKAKKQ